MRAVYRQLGRPELLRDVVQQTHPVLHLHLQDVHGSLRGVEGISNLAHGAQVQGRQRRDGRLARAEVLEADAQQVPIHRRARLGASALPAHRHEHERPLAVRGEVALEDDEAEVEDCAGDVGTQAGLIRTRHPHLRLDVARWNHRDVLVLAVVRAAALHGAPSCTFTPRTKLPIRSVLSSASTRALRAAVARRSLRARARAAEATRGCHRDSARPDHVRSGAREGLVGLAKIGLPPRWPRADLVRARLPNCPGLPQAPLQTPATATNAHYSRAPTRLQVRPRSPPGPDPLALRLHRPRRTQRPEALGPGRPQPSKPSPNRRPPPHRAPSRSPGTPPPSRAVRCRRRRRPMRPRPPKTATAYPPTPTIP